MKLARTLFAATALAAATLFVAPASADHGGASSGGSSGGSKDPETPTSVPEPSDAALLLLGATGLVIGRRLHARAQRKG
ncbi:MAG TPA: PEP-CTERM sorting domain-containing protein [Sphingomonas sp.]|nr:PEP-CTERM sorting domain-containing protein [Sphingomonas sp.]